MHKYWLIFCAPHVTLLTMDVVHKNNDSVLQGMLQDELERCKQVVSSLREDIAALPKGSLHQRKRNYKGKVAVYHFCKFRKEGKSVYEHVPVKRVALLEMQICDRRKKEDSLKKFNARLRYLKKLLKV